MTEAEHLVKRLRETQVLYEAAGVDGSNGALQAREAAALIEQQAAEIARLTRERSPDHLLATEWARLGEEHGRALAEVARLTRERDEARAFVDAIMAEAKSD
jgi:hypothetical protein